MALTPSTINDIAEAILACVCATLNDTADGTDLVGCPDCRVCVVPGQAAFDSCEDPCSGDAGGQLTVNLAQVYATTVGAFPTEDTTVRDAKSCTVPVMAAELVVTLLRCAPGVDEQGCPPPCDALSAAARQLHADVFSVFTGVLCCVAGTSTARHGRRFVMGRQRVVGPEGGCVGVEQRVTVALPGCPCPTE